MRTLASLILLLSLSIVSAAQGKPQPTQNAQNAIKTVTAKAKRGPAFDAFCQPGTISAFTNLPSGGGTWNVTWTYTISQTCGSPLVQTTATWLQPNDGSTTCSPNPQPLNTLITCTTPYAVTANTGATRSGQLFVSFGSSGEDGPVTITQLGPVELLSVSLNGSSGGGGVTSSPSGINCPGTCSVGVYYGNIFTLTASANTGYTFSGWSGACSGTGTCRLTMTSPQNVTGTFTALPETLTATVSGSGSVTSSPAGINSCTSTCSAIFSYPTSVQLSALPGTGYGFAGWSGACSGTGTCTVAMTGAKSVTATFKLLETLTVGVSGSGTVTSSPSGISCPGTCSAAFVQGTSVMLSASPAVGYKFTGWSGACSGSGACMVTMNAASSVTATFTSQPAQTLTVSVTGNGTVTSSPSGITCPGGCSAPFLYGTTVTLAASASVGYGFAGWSGACSGTGACVVTMNSAQTVGATFSHFAPGQIITLAGTGTAGYNGDGIAATSADLKYPTGVALDTAGNVYIFDENCRIRKVTASTGLISTVAGSGTCGYSGDNGPATSAELDSYNSVAADAAGNIYIADAPSRRIRVVNTGTTQIMIATIAIPAGYIATVAGNGTGGHLGDGGPATSAEFNSPLGVAVDTSGNIYVADAYNSNIRKVTASTGTISTVAGYNPPSPGYNGDGIAATSAKLYLPWGVAVDTIGNLYIADTNNNRTRIVICGTGITGCTVPAGKTKGYMYTVAGTGTAGYNGDGIAATSAQLNQPFGVAADASGNVYIVDTSNQRIRKVTASSGLISTVAGDGTGGYNGDGIAASSAEVFGPNGVALDTANNIYVDDRLNSRIRAVGH